MKKIFALFIVILAGILFISCEKEIQFNGDIAEPEIVMNSIINPDSAIAVYLSKSRFFLDEKNEFDSISNALVSLYVNNNFKENLLHLRSGYYKGNYVPATGDHIRLVANVPGTDKQAESSTVVLKPARIISLDTTQMTNFIDTTFLNENVVIGFYFSKTVYMKLKLKDDGNELNYYRLILKRRTKIPEDSLNRYYEYNINFALKGMDTQSGNLFEFDFDDNRYDTEHLITDELFNGKEFMLKFMTDYSYQYIKPEFEELFNFRKDEEELSINLQAISKETYLYYKTRKAADNIFDGLFAEPVQVYNNITNGLGILGSQTNNIYKLKLN